MYLFTRRARLVGGKVRESFAWAATIAEAVSKTSGLQVAVWAQAFSPAVGTVVWSTFAPDLSALEAGLDKLMGDDDYHALVAQGAEYALPGSIDDSLGVILHGAEPNPDREVKYVATVRSTMTAGGMARGIALGIEIAERAEQITKLPTSFLADATGNYGGVAWISSFTDIAELEGAQMALNTDQSFIELIDSNAAGVYTDQPGATTQLIYRRIA